MNKRHALNILCYLFLMTARSFTKITALHISLYIYTDDSNYLHKLFIHRYRYDTYCKQFTILNDLHLQEWILTTITTISRYRC